MRNLDAFLLHPHRKWQLNNSHSLWFCSIFATNPRVCLLHSSHFYVRAGGRGQKSSFSKSNSALQIVSVQVHFTVSVDKSFSLTSHVPIAPWGGVTTTTTLFSRLWKSKKRATRHSGVWTEMSMSDRPWGLDSDLSMQTFFDPKKGTSSSISGITAEVHLARTGFEVGIITWKAYLACWKQTSSSMLPQSVWGRQGTCVAQREDATRRSQMAWLWRWSGSSQTTTRGLFERWSPSSSAVPSTKRFWRMGDQKWSVQLRTKLFLESFWIFKTFRICLNIFEYIISFNWIFNFWWVKQLTTFLMPHTLNTSRI